MVAKRPSATASWRAFRRWLPWLLVTAALLTVGYIYLLTQINAIQATTSRQRELLQRQVDQSSKQIEIAETQLTDIQRQIALTQEQLDVSKQALQTAQETRGITAEQLERIQALHAILVQSLATQRQILNLTQAVLEEVREINRKSPDSLELAP